MTNASGNRLALRVPVQRAEAVLNGQIAIARELLRDREAHTDGDAYDTWNSRFERWKGVTKDSLRWIATNDEWRSEFEFVTNQIFRRLGPTNPAVLDRQYDMIRSGLARLEGFLERLPFVDSAVNETGLGGPTAGAGSERPQEVSQAVFIVHGRDEGLRDRVALVIARLGLDPIVLAEQPNGGRTLIEKFEANALDVGFAVVILTPDDFARGPDDPGVPVEPNRARQNVILELGYFMGKLGRHRVCPLYLRGTETPSDIHGLAYVLLDEGGAWQFKLGSELAAAGYQVDLNALR